MTLVKWVAAGMMLMLGPAAAWGQTNIRVQVPGVDGPVLLDSLAISHAVSAPVDRLLKAIEAVYADWGLPVESFDPQVGRFPNRRVDLRRRFRDKALSLYIDCGSGFAGNNADTYRITVATAAWPDVMSGTATKLNVALIGGGRDPSGNSVAYVVCTSRGRFEREFAAEVSAKLAATP